MRAVPAASDEDRVLARVMGEVALLPLGPSPMQPATSAFQPGSTAARLDASTPEFTLGSILSSRGRHLAMINGRPRAEGDTVRPGWTVASIDVEQGRVLLRSSAGQTVTLRLRNRSPDR
jgi:hypothetical protein